MANRDKVKEEAFKILETHPEGVKRKNLCQGIAGLTDIPLNTVQGEFGELVKLNGIVKTKTGLYRLDCICSKYRRP